MIFMPSHPFSVKGYIREHRLALEKRIGRYLVKGEVVHHKDGDTLNNDLNNLVLLTKKEHDRLTKEDHIRFLQQI